MIPDFAVFTVLALGVFGVPGSGRGPEPRDGDLVEVVPQPAGAPMVFYVNGVNTSGSEAVEQGKAVAGALGSGATLAYVDCSDLSIDWLATTVSKIGDFDTEINPAADTLLVVVLRELRAGHEVVLVGHSLGGAVVQNVTNEVQNVLSDADEQTMLPHLSVLLVGAACFSVDHPLSDGWPDTLGGLFSISDARDPIARSAGDVDDDWFPEDDSRHSLLGNYLHHVSRDRLWQTGRMIVDGETTLLEVVRRSREPQGRRIRWRVWSMAGQESRATLNATIPEDWVRLEWGVLEVARPNLVQFTPMADNLMWSDDAVSEALRDGSSTRFIEMDYLGRIDAPRQELNDGFVVEVRPMP